MSQMSLHLLLYGLAWTQRYFIGRKELIKIAFPPRDTDSANIQDYWRSKSEMFQRKLEEKIAGRKARTRIKPNSVRRNCRLRGGNDSFTLIVSSVDGKMSPKRADLSDARNSDTNG
jgi:hypothetical protein